MHVNAANWLSSIILVVFALTVIFVRLKASRKPTNARKIIIPPLGMSTGYLMFIAPQTHVSLLYAGIALLVGFLLSYPLILTSRMYRSGDEVYLKRSPAFVVVLLALVVCRIILHSYVESFISIPQTGALFFILAFGMLVPWRVAMLWEYRKLKNEGADSKTPSFAKVDG